MRAATWVVAAWVCGVLTGCAGPAGTGPQASSATLPAKPATAATAPAPGPAIAKAAAGGVVLEAEKCTLKDCQAKDLSGASGGKAVLMDKDTSEAQGTVELKKGTYRVVVYVRGASADEDAVYVTVGDGPKTRFYAGDHGSVVPATLYESEDQFFTATVDKDGPCKVLFTTAEKNVYVDRIVFARQD